MKTIGRGGPPRWAERLLQSLGADPEFTDEVLGDLAEEYLIRECWDGRVTARWWYYGQALRTSPHLLRNWRERMTTREAGQMVPSLLWSTLAGFTAHAVTVTSIGIFIQRLTGMKAGVYLDRASSPMSLVLLGGVLLICRCVTGMTAGWVAGVVNRRAPLLAALVVGTMYFALSVASMLKVPSLNLPVVIVFLATNLALELSCLAGGAVAALRHQRDVVNAES